MTKNTLHVKKGDKVKVISGKYKGKEGTITISLPSERKVVIEGINVLKKTTKAKKAGEKGGLIEIAMPLYASKVQKI